MDAIIESMQEELKNATSDGVKEGLKKAIEEHQEFSKGDFGGNEETEVSPQLAEMNR